ncbi:cysteine-rich CWC family protein [Vibrio algarum]|uniref:cysteine-rich CWC family protein n=1 Tax=Vibrio algarum TaxID=3020714 RepID=UPI00389985F0
MSNEINDKLCPFCKKDNRCMAMTSPSECWCNSVKVPIELQKLVPIELQRKSCVCSACVALFNSDPSAFRHKVFKE